MACRVLKLQPIFVAKLERNLQNSRRLLNTKNALIHLQVIISFMFRYDMLITQFNSLKTVLRGGDNDWFLLHIAVNARLVSNLWIYFGLTYDNGDKSDNWCGSHTKVPVEMILPAYYTTPKCGVRNLFGASKLQVEHCSFTEIMDNFICM